MLIRMVLLLLLARNTIQATSIPFNKQIIMRMKNDPRSIKMILGFSFNFNFRKRTIFFFSQSLFLSFSLSMAVWCQHFVHFLWCKFTTKLVVLYQVCLWFGIHLIHSISAFIQFYRWKQKQIVHSRQFFPDEKIASLHFVIYVNCYLIYLFCCVSVPFFIGFYLIQNGEVYAYNSIQMVVG